MTKSELKQLIKETIIEVDSSQNMDRQLPKVDNFLKNINNATVENPRMVGGKLIVDLITQTQAITVELILKNVKDK